MHQRVYHLKPCKTLTLLLSLLMALSGCTNDHNTNVITGALTQTLHIGNGAEPQDLDPHIVTGVTEHRIISALLEGLVGKDPKTLKPIPAVAESWHISDDRTHYRFRLRKNARWSNGDPVTAQDFVYSWKRILSPGLGAEYAYQLYSVLNAEAYHKGRLQDFTQVGVTAVDDHTLDVTLTNPTPYFLAILDHYSTYPVHRKTIEKFGSMDKRGNRWTKPENYTGNGPFTLKSWALNRIIKVEKNPTYWDAGNVKLNAIHFYPVENASTEERMFRTGQLHITSTLPAEKIAVYRQKNPDQLYINPYFGTYYYLFNTRRPPLDDKRVRQALAMSIDRNSIVTNITKGGQRPAGAFTPPNTLGYTAPTQIPFDPVRAKALFEEAGFPAGKNFPTLELVYNTSESHRKIAVAIQQMWKKHLNININLTNQDWKVYLARRKSGDYDIARAGWIGDYLSPNAFLEIFTRDSGNNHTGWSDPEYDARMQKSQRASNTNKRMEWFGQAEQLLLEAAPIAPIYTYTNVYLRSADVQGWHPNILDHHPYKYVYLSGSHD